MNVRRSILAMPTYAFAHQQAKAYRIEMPGTGTAARAARRM